MFSIKTLIDNSYREVMAMEKIKAIFKVNFKIFERAHVHALSCQFEI